MKDRERVNCEKGKEVEKESMTWIVGIKEGRKEGVKEERLG